MAPIKKTSSAKKSPQKRSVPEIPASLRRSTRVQKRSIDDSPSASPTKLAQAEKLLHEQTDRPGRGSSTKHVTFNAENADDAEPHHGRQTHQQHQEGNMLEERPGKLHNVPDEVQSLSSEHNNVQPASTAASKSRPRSESMAKPAYRRRTSRVVATNVGVDAQQSTGKKRSLENTDHVLHDHDNHHHHRGQGENHINPIKRRKGRGLTATSLLPQEGPFAALLTKLRKTPQALTLTQISRIFLLIQDRIFGLEDRSTLGFSERYFSFTLSDDQIDAWPLHELRTRYVPFYMTTRYVADGSQYGWRNFFTQPHSRPHLVSAILGEWFTQRIFKHTGFGFPQHLLDILEQTDREYLHYDAIVRSKERAKIMAQCYTDPSIRRSILATTNAMAESLADELLIVLHPLLPPSIFEPTGLDTSLSEHTASFKDLTNLQNGTNAYDLFAAIRYDLINLVKDCAALHKSIRLTGEDGTIVRIVPSLEKGTQFQPTAPVRCVNRQFCNDTVPTDPRDPTELCIKMTCWPRVEAIVPEGPDMAELELLEDQYRRELEEEANTHELTSSRSRQAHRRNQRSTTAAGAAPPSPSPSSSSSSASSAHSDANSATHSTSSQSSDPDAGFYWQDKDHHWPIVPRSLQDKEGLNAGTLDPETGKLNTLKRAAYVSIYSTLCPAKVYCEWTPPPNPERTKENTLDTAIHLARRTHAARIPLCVEDLSIELWNAYAIYGGLAQWGVLLAAAIYSASKYLQLPARAVSTVLKLTDVLRSHDLSSLSPSDQIARLRAAIDTLASSLGPFGPAVLGPFKTLVLDPLSGFFDYFAATTTTSTTTITTPATSLRQHLAGNVVIDNTAASTTTETERRNKAFTAIMLVISVATAAFRSGLARERVLAAGDPGVVTTSSGNMGTHAQTSRGTMGLNAGEVEPATLFNGVGDGNDNMGTGGGFNWYRRFFR